MSQAESVSNFVYQDMWKACAILGIVHVPVFIVVQVNVAIECAFVLIVGVESKMSRLRSVLFKNDVRMSQHITSILAGAIKAMRVSVITYNNEG